MTPRRSFGSKRPSRAHNRTALLAVLTHRESLAGVNVESLARSTGLAVAEVEKAVADERVRRGRVG